VFISSQPIPSRNVDTRKIQPGSAVLLEDIRWSRGDIKSTSLLGSVLLKKSVFESGKDEGILHRNGFITEGTASNVFIVKNQQILTPKLSELILTGITRDFIFELAEKNSLELIETDISIDALMSSDEVWLTSSTAEVKPIVEVDGKLISNGSVGPVWAYMASLYQQHKAELFTCGA
jgi:D-alanine transaminase